LTILEADYRTLELLAMASSWEERAADKRNRINDSIPQEWKIQSPPTEDSVLDFPKNSGILSDQELAITESSASDLVRKLAQGELKAVDVTVAFCKRAALAHQLVSIDRALSSHVYDSK
jgi:amidase